MSYDLWQTLANVAIFVGVVLAALGGFGQYYFGKKADAVTELEARQREQDLHQQVTSLVAKNDELLTAMQPLGELATQHFPSDDVLTAIRKLGDEYIKLDQRTGPTCFEVIDSRKTTLPNGGEEVVVRLSPRGTNLVPMLRVQCTTAGEVPITKFEVQGPTVPPMSRDHFNKAHSSVVREFQTFSPAPIVITIATDAPSGGINVVIDPLFQAHQGATSPD